jgi:hypothetical protein
MANSYDNITPDESDEDMLGEWIYYKFSQAAKLVNSNNHEIGENSSLQLASALMHSIRSPEELGRVQRNEGALMSYSAGAFDKSLQAASFQPTGGGEATSSMYAKHVHLCTFIE